MSADEPRDRAQPGDRADWEVLESSQDLDPGTADALKDLEHIAAFNRELQSAVTRVEASNEPEIEPGPWGHLMLLERVGAGAQGEVWRAWDATLQRQVALKFLQMEGGSGRRPSRDLIGEARALARLRHPGVVTVYGVAEHDGRAGMWMEWIEGLTLAKEIERRGALTVRDIARIGIDLCSALEALESAGIVHRDVKPANIVLEAGGRAVLTDLGLGWRPALDSAKGTSGTPLFMAPELLRGGKPSPQSDLYALGVTLWWALAGKPPFHAKSIADLRKEVARGPSTPLRAASPSVPVALAAAIEWAMNPDESRRPRSAAQMKERLALANPAGTEGAMASIAVLPFVNRSGNQEDEYFSDGLADELLDLLGKIQGLHVAARTSAFSFKGKDATIAEIGGALHVATVLEGSVRKVANRVRISVRLVNVMDGALLWSQSYDRTLADLFAVQDDIAQSVVRELRATLLGGSGGQDATGDAKADVAKAARGRSTDPEAHRLYLMARHLNDRILPEDAVKAIEYSREALERDPEFALAWAELSRTYANQANHGWKSVAEAFERSRHAAKRALMLEPDLAEAHSAIGFIQLVYDWDWGRAEASYKRAREMAPGSALVLRRACTLASALGRLDEAVQLAQRSVEQDPLNSGTYTNLAQALLAADHNVEAERAALQARDLAPHRGNTSSLLSLAMLACGRVSDALKEAAREPDEAWRLHAIAVIHHMAGNDADSDQALRELIEKFGDDLAYQIAEVHAIRGEASEAFRWLERAYALRDSGLIAVRHDPNMRSLHGDPRWNGFMKKMGFGDGAI